MIDDWRKTIPTVTRDEMVELDRSMIEDFGIELLQMMENAGRHLAQLTRDRFLVGDARGKEVSVLAGAGGNGGGALVAARRLHDWGANVEVALMRPVDAYDGVPAHQLHVAQKIGIRIVVAEDEPLRDGPEVILDGMVGYSLRGRPRGAIADAVRWAKAQPAPRFSFGYPDRARRDHRTDDAADGQSDRHDDARASQSGTRGPGCGGVHRGSCTSRISVSPTPSIAGSAWRSVLFFSDPICCDSASIRREVSMKIVLSLALLNT